MYCIYYFDVTNGPGIPLPASSLQYIFSFGVYFSVQYGAWIFQVFSVDLVQLIKIKKVYTMIDHTKHLHLHVIEILTDNTFRDMHIALKWEKLLEMSFLLADCDYHRSFDLSAVPLNIKNHKL